MVTSPRCPGSGLVQPAGVEPTAVVGDPDRDAVTFGDHRDHHARGGRVLPGVGHRLLRRAVERGPELGIGLELETIHDLERPSRFLRGVLQVLREGRHQPVTVERRRTEFEQQRPEPFDRLPHRLLQGGDEGGVHRFVALHHHAHAQVDGAHHLDRVVVDVGGDPATLLLLGALQAQREFAPLLDRAPQHLEAPPELLLGLLLGGDVMHESAPERPFASVGDDEGLVAQPHGAPVLRDEAVLGLERFPGLVRPVVLVLDPIAVVRVDPLEPQVGRGPPFLDREPEESLGLRARVPVRRPFIERVDVEDRRDALDERAIDVELRAEQFLAGRVAVRHSRATIPASREIRGTTLDRSSHSAGA